MNIEHVKKLRNLISKIPDHSFDMSNWLKIDRQEETVQQAIRSECGTVGCLAGWTYLLMKPKNKRLIADQLDSHEVQKQAAKYLGVSRHTAQYLFFGGWFNRNWHLPLRDITKEEALEVLNRIIAKKSWKADY